jgi:high-affinity nickel-transport protein
VRHWLSGLDRSERRRLSGFGAIIALLHVLGWGLFIYYSSRNHVLAGLGTLAYALGLRHAFDADHIAAIDNTTRKLMQEEKRPLGVGFCFSLGHSSVVFVLIIGLAVAAHAMSSGLSALQGYGSYLGASVSGVFLWLIGLLNLVVLVDVVRMFRRLRTGDADHDRLEQRLLERGFMSRFFIGRLFRFVSKSWHMFPIGLLFGLGFDTATEIGLLAVAAGVLTHHVSMLGVLSLPILFASGMSLLDTIDGAFMAQAYGWAFSNPVRKIYYNITITGLSVMVALGIGTIELMQVLSTKLKLSTGFWRWLDGLDFGSLGYALVALFVLTWAISVVVWKTARIEERWTQPRLSRRGRRLKHSLGAAADERAGHIIVSPIKVVVTPRPEGGSHG